jgi:hypothetical protein
MSVGRDGVAGDLAPLAAAGNFFGVGGCRVGVNRCGAEQNCRDQRDAAPMPRSYCI